MSFKVTKLIYIYQIYINLPTDCTMNALSVNVYTANKWHCAPAKHVYTMPINSPTTVGANCFKMEQFPVSHFQM